MTHIRRNHNLFVDGYSTHLECKDVSPPVVRDKTDETSAGALSAPYDVALGYQKFEGGFKLNSRQFQVMKNIGLAPGVHKRFTFRGVAISEIDGSQQDEIVIVEGRLNAEPDTWSAQSLSEAEFKIGSVMYYKHIVDGKILHEVDIKNPGDDIVNGQPRWPGLASGLGF